MKLADWYLYVSIVFVCVVFLEYVVVLWLTEREMIKMEEIAKKRKRRSGAANINNDTKPLHMQVHHISFVFY